MVRGMEDDSSPGIFRGWVVLTGLFITMAVTSGLGFYAQGVFLDALGDATKAGDSEVTWNVDVELAYLDLASSLENVLDRRKKLPEPQNNTLYQDYYVHVNGATESMLVITERFLRVKAGYSIDLYEDDISDNMAYFQEWIQKFDSLPSCTASNS